MTSVQFDITPSGRRVESGFAVYPDSLLFRAGNYVDKKLDMTPDHITAMSTDWQALRGNMLHSKMLQGRAIHVDKVWTAEDGNVLRGEVRIPLGLDELLTDDEKKVSLEIDRVTKRATGIALTYIPRVSDAVLMSLDDALDDAFLDSIIATFAGKTISSASADKINAAHDALVTLHPDCCPASASAHMSATSGERNFKPMSWLDKIMGREATPAETAEFHNEIKTLLPEPADTTAQFAQLDTKIDEQIARARLREAKAFVSELLSQGKLTAEGNKSLLQMQADLVAQFCLAAEDDDARPRKVTFSLGDKTQSGTRVEALEAEWGNKSAKISLNELMETGNPSALFNRESSTKEKTQAERDAIHERLMTYISR